MSLDLTGIIRDVLVIGYLFVLRLGVPLLITLLGGSWLRKLLDESEQRPRNVSPTLNRPQPRPRGA